LTFNTQYKISYLLYSLTYLVALAMALASTTSILGLGLENIWPRTYPCVYLDARLRCMFFAFACVSSSGPVSDSRRNNGSPADGRSRPGAGMSTSSELPYGQHLLGHQSPGQQPTQGHRQQWPRPTRIRR